MHDDAEQSQVYRRRRPAQDTQRDALRDAIAREELVFAKLQADQAESMRRLTSLRAELATLDAEAEIHVSMALSLEAPIPRTPADKVRLFRSLFRGRQEVFPTRFESRKTGKSVIEENLAMPFETVVLGVPVMVERVDLSRNGQIVAICKRGLKRQLLSILDLPLLTPLPDGAEWIEAYRRWRAENDPSGDA